MSGKDEKTEPGSREFLASTEDLEFIKEISATNDSEPKDKVISKGEFKTTDVPIPAVQFEELTTVEAPKTGDDLTNDYNYIRTNIYTITERSIEALNNLVQIADQSQHPRAYEVVALLVNTIANAQKDLMTIHKDKSKITGMNLKNSPEVVNNNLFVGNTAQLDEIISKMTREQKGKKHE